MTRSEHEGSQQSRGRAVPPAGYSIQPARLEHVALLPAIERAAATRFGDTLPRSVLDDATPMDALTAAQHAGLLWVALEPGGEPVGFTIASACGARAHLEELDVLPEHGRRGVGSALVAAVEDWARENGLTEITLTTFRDVPWNAPLYARLGFHAIAEDELDVDLRQRLSHESAMGLDRASRQAMRKVLGPTPESSGSRGSGAETETARTRRDTRVIVDRGGALPVVITSALLGLLLGQWLPVTVEGASGALLIGVAVALLLLSWRVERKATRRLHDGAVLQEIGIALVMAGVAGLLGGIALGLGLG